MTSATISSQPENDSASMSGSDSKKRNKLGYHRTAVACGHCRRRKIRCIPSNDPTETKCANCIRLKKECQFYPVDQHGSSTRKHRSSSRAEPSANEPSLSRTSASPDQQPAQSISDSFDTPYTGRTSSSSAWVDSAGVVTSPPGRLRSVQTTDQQDWTHSSPQALVQHQYSQPDSHAGTTAGAYWLQSDDNAAMDYQQQYAIAVTSGAFTQEPHLAYHNGFHDARNTVGRQSFSGVPSSGIDHSPNSYRYYNGTFPEIERSITMPVNMFNHTTMHSTPQLVAGPGQVVYDQGYPQQMAHHTQAWFSPPRQHSAFTPQYLQTHQERKYSQYTS